MSPTAPKDSGEASTSTSRMVVPVSAVSAIVLLCLGAFSWGEGLKADLADTRMDTAHSLSLIRADQALVIQALTHDIQVLTRAVQDLNEYMEDRWTRTDMKDLLDLWRAKEPGLAVPTIR